MKNILKPFILSAEGATAVEYAIMASLIAVVIVATVTLIGSQVNAMIQSVISAFGS